MGEPVSTNHYSIEAWTDFARGLDPAGQRREMQSHLDGGCSACRRRLELLELAWVSSAMEAASEPPKWVVERALSVFPSPASRPASDWIRLAGELFFDSWLTPAAAGLRAGSGASRQLRYRAGDLEVELHLDRSSGIRNLQIIGQISTAGGASGLGQAKVDLHAGRITRAADCNDFGEFHLETKAEPGLRLQIHLPDRNESLELILPD
jgi:hypothetical protein